MRLLLIAGVAGMIPLWFALWSGRCRQRTVLLEELVLCARELRQYAAMTGESIECIIGRIPFRSPCLKKAVDLFSQRLSAMTTEEAWESAVTDELWEKRSVCGMRREDRAAVLALGRGMGTFLSRQQELLSAAQTELETLLLCAREEEKKTCGLYRRLGWIAAGMAVILLW